MHDEQLDCLVPLQMRKYVKKGKLMHSLSVYVCPCLGETVYARTFCMGIFDCIALTSCRVLTQLKTASSSSWGGSPTSF